MNNALNSMRQGNEANVRSSLSKAAAVDSVSDLGSTPPAMQFRSTLSPSSGSDGLGTIQVRGARENNLKNISVDIPRRRITVFTGVSGSGKSSLVFDTIAAESQRLLNETFPTFVQNFLPRY